MAKIVSSLAVLGCLLLFSVSLSAHHGQAGYNVTETVTVSGAVTDFQFVNPHSIVSMDAKDDKGATQGWQGELTSPNHLVRAGCPCGTPSPRGIY